MKKTLIVLALLTFILAVCMLSTWKTASQKLNRKQ
jgi:hypothetical protein